eukprot:1125041-Ditylum_brightwellii.AAC.2
MENVKEALVWRQGIVLAISDSTNMAKIGHRSAKYKKEEAIMICWDANEDLEETSTESSQKLLKSKWNLKGRHSE